MRILCCQNRNQAHHPENQMNQRNQRYHLFIEIKTSILAGWAFGLLAHAPLTIIFRRSPFATNPLFAITSGGIHAVSHIFLNTLFPCIPTSSTGKVFKASAICAAAGTIAYLYYFSILSVGTRGVDETLDILKEMMYPTSLQTLLNTAHVLVNGNSLGICYNIFRRHVAPSIRHTLTHLFPHPPVPSREIRLVSPAA